MKEDFYNPDIKLRFLSAYPESTQNTYSYIFKKSSELEFENQKDLCEFSLSEFIGFFEKLNMNYNSSAQSNGRIVTAYVDWTIDNNIKNTSDNILKRVNTKWFQKFVNDDVKLFYTLQEIYEISKKCVNAQDAVIIMLLFDGVQGKAVSEIRNLDLEDLIFYDDDLETDKEEIEIRVKDHNDFHRKATITSSTLDLIKRAMEEKYYIKSNGQMLEKENIRDYTELVNSSYIIRSSNTGKVDNTGPVDKYVIYRRISAIEKSLNLENFTVKNIVRSGMLSTAMSVAYSNKIPINKDVLEYVSIKYNVNSYNALKSFITSENIFILYGVDVGD